jgi:H+/Cl- antiporter ClcA
MLQDYYPTFVVQLWREQLTWLIRAIVVGALVGSVAALFLWLLDAATTQRQQAATNYWLYLLPLWGILGHWIYQRWGQEVAGGNNLILQRLAVGSDQLPARMAPLIIITTVISHLFGASVGREGTAVQSGAAISATVARYWPTSFWPTNLRLPKLSIAMLSNLRTAIMVTAQPPVAASSTPATNSVNCANSSSSSNSNFNCTNSDSTIAASFSPIASSTTSVAVNPAKIWLLIGISAGFGAVFGTPLAGTVFAAEVALIGSLRYEGLLACLISAITGDLVCRGWGATHSIYPVFHCPNLTVSLLAKLALAGIAFGLVALLFIELTQFLTNWGQRRIAAAPARGFIGGLIILALTVGLAVTTGLQTTDYLGLSLSLLAKAVNGEQLATGAFLVKILFTAISLAAGFKGGEVTPLFVIGATAGYTLAGWLGLPAEMLAKLGFLAVFAAAANTPLSCLLMGIELFGGEIALPAAWVCWLAYLSSGHRSIYSAQQVGVAKAG